MRRLLTALLLALTLLVSFAVPTQAAPSPARSALAVAAFTQYTATASVSRPAPTWNQRQTITGTMRDAGKPVVGAKMTAIWKYKTTTSTCTATTNAQGVAACTRSISHATPGYTVRVLISFTKDGKVLATTATSFTPRH